MSIYNWHIFIYIYIYSVFYSGNINTFNHQVLKPEYFGITRPTPWLPIPWFLALRVGFSHWLYWINVSLSLIRNDFIFLRISAVSKYMKCKCMLNDFYEQLSMLSTTSLILSHLYALCFPVWDQEVTVHAFWIPVISSWCWTRQQINLLSVCSSWSLLGFYYDAMKVYVIDPNKKWVVLNLLRDVWFWGNIEYIWIS